LEKVDEQWEPMALRFNELVACTEGEKQEVIEKCEYTGGGGATIERVIIRMTIRLFDSKTGFYIGNREFVGSPPKECPSTTHSGGKMLGEYTNRNDIKTWLKAFVNPPIENQIGK
jgi:hypothetical protein